MIPQIKIYMLNTAYIPHILIEMSLSLCCLLYTSYKYKRYFLNKPLYNYVIYEDSMSRGDSNYEKSRYRFEEHEEIIKKV